MKKARRKKKSRATRPLNGSGGGPKLHTVHLTSLFKEFFEDDKTRQKKRIFVDSSNVKFALKKLN
jgi:hypothetical protein